GTHQSTPDPVPIQRQPPRVAAIHVPRDTSAVQDDAVPARIVDANRAASWRRWFARWMKLGPGRRVRESELPHFVERPVSVGPESAHQEDSTADGVVHRAVIKARRRWITADGDA